MRGSIIDLLPRPGIRRKLRTLVNQQRVNAVLNHFKVPYLLHVGCGTVKFDGWINLDLNAGLTTVDLVWDLRQGLPLDSGSCAVIYSEHVLEHLKVEAGVAFLKECHRVLIPGGVLRIAMPSLDALIEGSYTGTWREQAWLKQPEYRFISNRAEMLNVAFRAWGHEWLYDREELHRRLREAGFGVSRDVGWGESQVDELCNRETRADSLLIAEAVR